MLRLTHHVSVIRMTNRRRGVHVDLRVAVSVIKRLEFLKKVFAVTSYFVSVNNLERM